MQLGRNHIDKFDFIKAYKSARAAALNTLNIYSEFAAIGLIPHDLQRVLSHLYHKLRTPTPPKPETTITVHYTPKTPYTVAQVNQKYITIKDLLKQRSEVLQIPQNRR